MTYEAIRIGRFLAAAVVLAAMTAPLYDGASRAALCRTVGRTVVPYLFSFTPAVLLVSILYFVSKIA